MSLPTLTPDAVRRIAAQASLFGADWPRPKDDDEAILRVARHFGSIQIDPTRTVEKTHYLVLWSRIGSYDRNELARLTYQARRLFEHNAFYVPIERLSELRYEARPWIDRWPRVQKWIATNRKFHDSILHQLRDQGPLPSRAIDDSMIVEGWESTGWTHGRNTTRMLEFMGKALEVMVSGREGQERLWDLPERVIPTQAPTNTLDDDAYAASRLSQAMTRFGVADLAQIKARTYWTDKKALARAIERAADDGQLVPVNLPNNPKKRPAWATPRALAVDDSPQSSRTTLLSPFDPLIYDRERTELVFDFKFKLEMYVPKEERQFGHFTLPVLYDNALIGRLDSEVDRKSDAFVVNKLHWEGGQPKAATRDAVNAAIDELAAFVGATEVRRPQPPTS